MKDGRRWAWIEADAVCMSFSFFLSIEFVKIFKTSGLAEASACGIFIPDILRANIQNK
jgi:hypothetical protein